MIWGTSHPGKIRRKNEDSYSVYRDRSLFVVADGMGGHNAGEIASRQAVEAIGEYLTSKRLSATGFSDEKIGEAMKHSILHAHRQINRLAAQKRAYAGMGTTIIAALMRGNRLHLCHVGDSRGYLAGQEGIKLLTKDHSYVMSLVDSGIMSMAEAHASPLKNQLTMALGIEMEITPGYTARTIQRDDIVLLCSDGLWDMISDAEIYRLIKSKDSAISIGQALIEAANTVGGHDNITVIVAICRDGTPNGY